MHAPPKVSNFQLSAQPHEQVLRLDVAMDHFLGVAVLQCVRQLGDELEQDHVQGQHGEWQLVSWEDSRT